MSRLVQAVLRVATLTGVYLLTLTSSKPGDVLTGVVLSSALILALRYLPGEQAERGTVTAAQLKGVPALLIGSFVDVVRGSWQVSRCCVWGHLPNPGLVELDIGKRSETSAAVWGVRTGLSPDVVVVDIDLTEGRMLLHVLNASDPDAVRDDELQTFERRQRRVFP